MRESVLITLRERNSPDEIRTENWGAEGDQAEVQALNSAQIVAALDRMIHAVKLREQLRPARVGNQHEYLLIVQRHSN